MKYLKEEFPKGTFPKQATDGAYINDFLSRNLDVYAERLGDDMHFLIIIAGNDSVGNGKSTLATHVGTYLTHKINEKQKTNNTFTSKNIALKAKDLVTQSFENPKYSVNVLDEGDDLTTHGMRQAAVELKRYFRKCRQLNQILILIIPSFFELPKFYALARSHALLNVKFHSDFRRGTFDFYGPKSKKKLYLKGKREWDYDCVRPDFHGDFFSNYTFFPNLEKEVELYKAKKYEDMVEDADGETNTLTPIQVEATIKAKAVRNLKKMHPEMTQKQIAEVFGIGTRSVFTYLKEGYGEENEDLVFANSDSRHHSTIEGQEGENFTTDQ